MGRNTAIWDKHRSSICARIAHVKRGGANVEIESMIQGVLDEIERLIKEDIDTKDLARRAGYSLYHFRRIFIETTGTPVGSYITRRKLEHALYELAQGRKVLDVALEYGFHTHAGFTKAFKKHFGYPPSLHRLRLSVHPSLRAGYPAVNTKNGGLIVDPYIIEMTPFIAAGRVNRQNIANVRRTADIPAFDFDPRAAAGELLDNSNSLFPRSKHCEIEMCYDVDEETGCFYYFVGRGVTHPEDVLNIASDMVTYEIHGLYAVFSTPPTAQEHFEQAIRDTWGFVLEQWLPSSEFEYDETRKDYEYHDYRTHGWYFGGKKQSDICIPVRLRKAAAERARMMDNEFWDDEMQLRGRR